MYITRYKAFAFIAINVIILSLISCNKKKEVSFFKTKNQNTENRSVKDTLESINTVKLRSIGIFVAGDIEYNKGYLYIPGLKKRKIYKIEGDLTRVKDTIGNGKGQGPGEAQGINKIEVHDDKLIVPDSRQRKIMVFNTKGGLIREMNTESFPPKGIEVIENKEFLINSGSRPGMAKFYTINNNGSIEDELIGIDKSENPLKYNGFIDRGEEGFYFVGTSEPVLKSLTFNGKTRFSRTTINNIPTSQNYTKSQFGDNQVRYSFSNAALYSSYDLVYDREKIYVLPIHNYEGETNSYVDVYSPQNGDYVYSFLVRGNPRHISLGEDSELYVIENINGNTLLSKYRIHQDE